MFLAGGRGPTWLQVPPLPERRTLAIGGLEAENCRTTSPAGTGGEDPELVTGGQFLGTPYPRASVNDNDHLRCFVFGVFVLFFDKTNTPNQNSRCVCLLGQTKRQPKTRNTIRAGSSKVNFCDRTHVSVRVSSFGIQQPALSRRGKISRGRRSDCIIQTRSMQEPLVQIRTWPLVNCPSLSKRRQVCHIPTI